MHEKFLLAALEQAKLGQGFCAPNPSVGAVAVQNGSIIAQSYHKGAGTPHAEPLLLAQLPPKIPDISLYITLEPCNHWGKTPPCVDSIIGYGVKEVIFSFLDPNPIVAQNNSIDILRKHGIKVTHLPFEPITAFYKSYEYWTKTGKPWVTVKLAQSLDGRIGYANKERVLLSNALCSQFTHEHRLRSDIILTTARTIQSDNPKMNVRLHGQEQAKPVAIIDTHLSLDKNTMIFSTARHCHVYHHKKKTVSYPNSYFHSMPLKNKKMNLSSVISHLGALGYHDIWVEAGAALFTSLHREHLVNRTYLYITPHILGTNGILAYKKNSLFDKKHAISWNAMGDNMIVCLDWQEE